MDLDTQKILEHILLELNSIMNELDEVSINIQSQDGINQEYLMNYLNNISNRYQSLKHTLEELN